MNGKYSTEPVARPAETSASQVTAQMAELRQVLIDVRSQAVQPFLEIGVAISSDGMS